MIVRNDLGCEWRKRHCASVVLKRVGWPGLSLRSPGLDSNRGFEDSAPATQPKCTCLGKEPIHRQAPAGNSGFGVGVLAASEAHRIRWIGRTIAINPAIDGIDVPHHLRAGGE